MRRSVSAKTAGGGRVPSEAATDEQNVTCYEVAKQLNVYFRQSVLVTVVGASADT